MQDAGRRIEWKAELHRASAPSRGFDLSISLILSRSACVIGFASFGCARSPSCRASFERLGRCSSATSSDFHSPSARTCRRRSISTRQPGRAYCRRYVRSSLGSNLMLVLPVGDGSNGGKSRGGISSTPFETVIGQLSTGQSRLLYSKRGI